MWDLIFEKYMVFLMVFMRMSGMILFNPLFGRRNVPVNIKMGLALSVAVIITNTISGADVAFIGIFDFAVAGLKELLVGFALSFIMELAMSAYHIAGEMIDLQLGVSMSKIYDPQSNISMPLSGSIFNIMFVLMFFAGNGHLNLIKIISLSFNILPPGFKLLGANLSHYIVMLMSNILILAVKLCMPVVAIEIITEIGFGVLMRTVPQINLFVAGLQLKLLVGFAIILFIIPQVSELLDYQISWMFEQLEKSIKLLA